MTGLSCLLDDQMIICVIRLFQVKTPFIELSYGFHVLSENSLCVMRLKEWMLSIFHFQSL